MHYSPVTHDISERHVSSQRVWRYSSMDGADLDYGNTIVRRSLGTRPLRSCTLHAGLVLDGLSLKLTCKP